MGTNYYVRLNHCSHCDRNDRLHIGKSSSRWAFHFRGYSNKNYSLPEGEDGFIFREEIESESGVSLVFSEDVDLHSWTSWKKFLKGKIIVDEDGDKISFANFVVMIESVKSPGYVFEDGIVNRDHITEILGDGKYCTHWNEYTDTNKHWHDELGYSFSKPYFG